MLVAAIDTATPTLSCALLELRGGAVEVLTTRTDRQAGPGAGHGIRLPGALTDLLGALGRKVPDVEGFAVGLGPGSFTGLRIGLATWKGLAYANRRPIAGVSSLAAMALEAATRKPLSLRTREVANLVGILLLVFLMVFVFKNDIVRLMG